tara:strand:+ start:954 stop:1142 length:189 start_codon:yes stop_codon:yes gene_type:complete
MRLIEEIYSYKFDRKSVSGAAEAGPIQNLQEASARYISFKYKTKTKIDQLAMDFITSIEYHR